MQHFHNNILWPPSDVCGFVKLIQKFSLITNGNNSIWKKKFNKKIPFSHPFSFTKKMIQKCSLKMLEKHSHSLNIDWPFEWLIKKSFIQLNSNKIFMVNFYSVFERNSWTVDWLNCFHWSTVRERETKKTHRFWKSRK